jgi:protease II
VIVLHLHHQDLATGKELMTPIPNTSGDVVWANDNATLFYIMKVSSKCMRQVPFVTNVHVHFVTLHKAAERKDQKCL